MPFLRAAAIVTVFTVVTLVLIPWQWLGVAFDMPHARSFPHRYHKFVARLFGLKLKLVGTPPAGGALILANHIGWLDIVIFSALLPVSFVAKAEVRDWPFFGALARLQRTVFVTRERRSQTGRARDAMAARLRQGDALVLFPEGTSHDGNGVLPFKSALLGAAEVLMADARPVPVYPASTALVCRHGIPMGRENRPLYAWYGDMALLPHLWGALTAGPLDVVVEFHPPMRVETMDRKMMAAQAEALVRQSQAKALAGIA